MWKRCCDVVPHCLQVIRVVTSPLYGWSEQTSNFVQNFDVVYLFTDVVMCPSSVQVLHASSTTSFAAMLNSRCGHRVPRWYRGIPSSYSPPSASWSHWATPSTLHTSSAKERFTSSGPSKCYDFLWRHWSQRSLARSSNGCSSLWTVWCDPPVRQNVLPLMWAPSDVLLERNEHRQLTVRSTQVTDEKSMSHYIHGMDCTPMRPAEPSN